MRKNFGPKPGLYPQPVFIIAAYDEEGRANAMNAPLIDELPMAVECRLISYDAETCRFIGEIVNVCADKSVLNDKGKVDPAKLRPITFDPMNYDYLVLGDKVGKAFHDGVALRG